MDALNGNSTLSNEEISEKFENADLFSGIMGGLEKALAYERGKAKAETIARKRCLPDVNVSEVRKSMNMTQRNFAGILGVSPRTVESWETGRSNPSPTARNLIFLIMNNPNLISQLQNREISDC